MTDDDLEPRLSDHLRQRAARVSPPADLDDIHRRVAKRERRTSRALGAALTVALIAGPLLGWTLARSTESDRDALTAGGGAASEAGSGNEGGTSGVLLENQQDGYGYAELDFVSERTTGEGIRLVVRSTQLGPADREPCAVDGIVRVGVVDGQLVDVMLLSSSPAGATFGIAGGADGRPMWVVVARSTGPVEAVFPNGAVDSAEPVSGVAVLAAYGSEGTDWAGMTDDTVQVTGLPGRAVSERPREVTIDDGNGGCPGGSTPIGPPVDLTMPAPGEPPADEASARAEVEELYLEALKGPADSAGADLREKPNVWFEAQERFRAEHPDYYEWSHHVYSVVHEIVFTAPDRASVRYSLVSDDPAIPAPGERIGEAVLIDGTWRIAIETSCGNLELAGIACDYSLKE